jgi:hypothetical protein
MDQKTELFTKTPPTESGWYWLQDNEGNKEVAELDPDWGWDIGDSEMCVWRAATDRANRLSEMVEWGYVFGPRIPSLQECAEVTAIEADEYKNAALRWAANQRAITQIEKLIRDGRITYHGPVWTESPEMSLVRYAQAVPVVESLGVVIRTDAVAC